MDVALDHSTDGIMCKLLYKNKGFENTLVLNYTMTIWSPWQRFEVSWFMPCNRRLTSMNTQNLEWLQYYMIVHNIMFWIIMNHWHAGNYMIDPLHGLIICETMWFLLGQVLGV